MKSLKVKITGISPLLMHSDRGANKLDPLVRAHKELTSKKKKTEEDDAAIAKSEYMLALYLGKNNQPVMPTQNIRATIIEGARQNKRGKDIESGTIILESSVPLEYKGPKDPEKLFQTPEFVDARGVVVQRARIMRYRPCFPEWSCQVEINYDPAKIDEADLLLSLENAGKYVGLGDFRPGKKGTFGRFEVAKIG
jgi:hypothetical protein